MKITNNTPPLIKKPTKPQAIQKDKQDKTVIERVEEGKEDLIDFRLLLMTSIKQE